MWAVGSEDMHFTLLYHTTDRRINDAFCPVFTDATKPLILINAHGPFKDNTMKHTNLINVHRQWFERIFIPLTVHSSARRPRRPWNFTCLMESILIYFDTRENRTIVRALYLCMLPSRDEINLFISLICTSHVRLLHVYCTLLWMPNKNNNNNCSIFNVSILFSSPIF